MYTLFHNYHGTLFRNYIIYKVYTGNLRMTLSSHIYKFCEFEQIHESAKPQSFLFSVMIKFMNQTCHSKSRKGEKMSVM